MFFELLATIFITILTTIFTLISNHTRNCFLCEFFFIIKRYSGDTNQLLLWIMKKLEFIWDDINALFMSLSETGGAIDLTVRKFMDIVDFIFYINTYYTDLIYFFEPLLWLILFFILFILPIFIIIAYSTLLERKLMGSIQRRQGPNVVGIKGLLQPLADGLKLLIKEFFWPKKSYFGIYFFAAGLGLLISLYIWIFLPLNSYPTVSLPIVLLFILAIQIIETYSLILAGWASNSKYALLGALRTTAQMISYELALSFILLSIVIICGTLDLLEIIFFQINSIWLVFPLFPLFGLFLCASLAETNRTPFDLPEAEAELVAGYNVEYSGMLFALFFLAEYSNMAFLSTLISILFLGGWDVPGIFISNPYVQSFVLGTKTASLLFFFVWIRATLPRYRYDQLMDLGWKVFLPFTFAFFMFLFIILYYCGALPIALLSYSFFF